jgi:methionine-rich copper-binding protein CopC
MTKKKKKQTPKQDIATAQNPFPYAYNYYYMLDLPAPQAFKAFMHVMHTRNKDLATDYLYHSAIKHGDSIRKMFNKSTVKYREGIEERFNYINIRMQELKFREERKNGIKF